MIKNIVLGLAAASIMASCNVKENKELKARVDSLQVELQASEKTAQMLQEVGVMLDSIETNRLMLRSGVVEGTRYTDYSGRLKNLNSYIRETQGKLTELETSLKKSKASSSSYMAMVTKLKAELQNSTQQVAALQQEVENVRTENQSLVRTVSQKDSLITTNTEVIKVKEQDIATLETKVEEINKNAINTQADMYFAQGQALELAASRTQFAPRKKKEAKREALELYKRAYSLGKEDAKSRINELEKDLS
jgi:chromosome segregation ATPase